MGDTTLWWVRHDLRLHDNEALVAGAASEKLIPVYCFDPRLDGEESYGGSDSFQFKKTGQHRLRFRHESVTTLREQLREHGSDLIVRHGTPEAVLPEIAAMTNASRGVLQTLPAPEEMAVEAAVKTRLRDAGCAIERVWSHTLYHINDLPTPYESMRDTYTPFRKSVEADATVRDPLTIPNLPPVPTEIDPGEITPVDRLDPSIEKDTPGNRGVYKFSGGETAGLDRVAEYLWETDHVSTYKKTRNGMLGAAYSTKFSPWLNDGSLSPRTIEHELRAYEKERTKNESTYWVLFELIWRDFFQFQVAKHGGAFFSQGGIQQRTDIEWRNDDAQFDRWCRGETGIPFVDANMQELNQTGFMSNRGRQNVASFLVNNLRIDWRRGAAYFETQLIDYDPCSNYGNWAYIAGVGNDSRDRYFNIIKQARNYDENAAYVHHWLPELAALPPKYAHEPWEMSPEEQSTFDVKLGTTYPEPMINLDASYEKLQ